MENELREENEKLASIDGECSALYESKQQILGTLAKYDALIASKTPEMTVDAARMVIDNWHRCDDSIQRYRNEMDKILSEQNVYAQSLDDLKTRIATVQAQVNDLQAVVDRDNLLWAHYKYINRVYSDRNKIKSIAFKEQLPFINNRLKYYFDVFGLDIKLTITDNLSVESDKWSYDFESGGERKRTDVAFMLALFDFHEYMYGRQSNILVLDEVDGRMDNDGIESLISVIKNDIATRVETILIVSHRDLMHDTFAREIRVTRKNRFSTLELI